MSVAGELSPLMRAQLATPRFFTNGVMQLSSAMRDVLQHEFGAEPGEYVVNYAVVRTRSDTLRALARRGLVTPHFNTALPRRMQLTPLGAQIRASIVPPPESPAKCP